MTPALGAAQTIPASIGGVLLASRLPEAADAWRAGLGISPTAFVAALFAGKDGLWLQWACQVA
jgi:hypothetical protein